MQISTPILAFFSAQDMLIILFVFLVPILVIGIIAAIALRRRKGIISARDTQIMLLSGILEELKKLNAQK